MELSLLIVGGGKMGYAIAKSTITQGIFPPKLLGIVEPSAERRKFLKADLDCLVVNEVEQPPAAKIILLAVKPGLVTNVLKQYQDTQKSLFISIIAGVTIASLQKSLPTARIVKVMPNTPCIIGCGMSVYFSHNTTTEDDQLVSKILSGMGKALQVKSEKQIDAATAISGSGPGFVYAYALATFQQALDFGFSEAEANLLVRQNFFGAGKMLKHFTDKSIEQLIADVATPGGTTAAGLNTFSEKKLDKTIAAGLKDCLSRSLKIGQNA